MPQKTVAKAQEIYRIKVTLLGTNPPIWRRLLVPADFTLEQLHGVLQIAMGWQNSHMHEFTIGHRRFGPPPPAEADFDGPLPESERRAKLSNVLGAAGATAIYTYDFGDSWEHEIEVEEHLAADPRRACPACVGGERHAPPEDCGGIPGFYMLLEALRDPRSRDRASFLGWFGGRFDPDAFSTATVNRRLAALRRPRSKTAGKK